jgi:Rrf2 family protein
VRLSKPSAQAALAMAFLAGQADDEIIRASEVARYLHVPTDSALKVLQCLSRTGLIHSRLGRHGGYCLHKPAEEITLLQVVEATDGPMDAQLPLLHREAGSMEGVEVLRKLCVAVSRRVRQELAGKTVADLSRAYRRRAKAGRTRRA